MFAAAILAHQGMNHEALEVPSDQETQAMNPALLQAVRIVDADAHTHRESPSSTDQRIGKLALEALTSGSPFQRDQWTAVKLVNNGMLYLFHRRSEPVHLPEHCQWKARQRSRVRSVGGKMLCRDHCSMFEKMCKSHRRKYGSVKRQDINTGGEIYRGKGDSTRHPPCS